MKFALFLIASCSIVSAFLPHRFQFIRSKGIAAGKPDLFSGNNFHLFYSTVKRSKYFFICFSNQHSDDLFEENDEDDSPKKNVVKKSTDIEPDKRKYLDQDWTLSPEDAKDFKGFPSKSGKIEPPEPTENVPLFALMYKFRREYLGVSVDALMADHRGHSEKYKRLISSEVIDMGNAKGVVLLWGGYTEDDKVDTKSEITTFVEEDPLIAKDAIESWDLIELQSTETTEADAPMLPKA